MNKVFYLEPDEEITSVVDRIRNAETAGVVLVLPRGGTLAQSIVNLKLLKRSASEFGREIFLVTSDHISKNLAERLKIKIFSGVKEAENAKADLTPEAAPDDETQLSNYKKYDLSALNKRKEQNKSLYDDVLPEETDADEPEESGSTIDEVSDDVPSESDGDKFSDKDESSKGDSEEVLEAAASPAFKTRKIPVIENNHSTDEKKEADKKMATKHLNPGGSRKILVLSIALILVLGLATSLVLLPTASASLKLKTSDYAKEFNLKVDKNVEAMDSEKMVIPGKLVSLEKEVSKKVDATGAKNVGDKASGTVTISNLYDAEKSVLIEKGTVISRDGKNFVIQKSVYVPKYTGEIVTVNGKLTIKETPGTVDADVIAADPGDQYNLAVGKFAFSTFTGERRDKITAENKAAFAGGSNKQVKFVTDSDIKNADESIRKDALPTVQNELIENSKKENTNVLEKYITTEVVSAESTAKENDQVDSFDYRVKVKATSLAFAESDIRDLAVELVDNGMKTDEMIVSPEKAMVTYEATDSNIDSGIINLSAKFSGKIGKKIAVDKIQSDLKMKNKMRAASYLQGIEGVESSDLAIRPGFWLMTPVLSSKIKVDFDYN